MQLTVISQLDKRRNHGRWNIIFIALEQLNNQWNGSPNFLTKFGFESASATSQLYMLQLTIPGQLSECRNSVVRNSVFLASEQLNE